MRKIYTRKRECHEMRYGCGQDASEAHQERMPRDFQDRIDLDDLNMITTRFGRRYTP
jgi:hypothetical protein